MFNEPPLPLLSTAKPTERLELFAKKLRYCCYNFDFEDTDTHLKEKELKRIYLNEIIELMETGRGILIEPIYAMSFSMFAHNIFRPLPPKDPKYDPDEDDPITTPDWPHLQLVYTYLFRVLESPDFQPSEAKNFIDHRFVCKLLDRFATDDLNERECLKTALHRIYGKFLGLRAFIRRVINHKFLEMLYEDLKFPGVVEILEVLGSIINGYACPLKQEHKQFLFQILLPLHSSPDLQRFQAQLVYCVVQYLEKEPTLTEPFVRKFLKRWPRTVSAKEVMFLGELEEVIDVMQPAEFVKVQVEICKKIAESVKSEHFQVAERALYFWDNEYIVSLLEANSALTFPLLLPSLQQVSNTHWNKIITTMSSNVIKNFMTVNQKFFTTMICNIKNQKNALKERQQQSSERWRILEIMAEASRHKLTTSTSETKRQ